MKLSRSCRQTTYGMLGLLVASIIFVLTLGSGLFHRVKNNETAVDSTNLTTQNNQQNITVANQLLLHNNVVTTVFWIGESADSDNGNISNKVSAWDESWMTHYGGIDSPDKRNGYHPADFTPKENPFYFALPYNDFNESGGRKESASSCPGANSPELSNYSWCKNSWIKISANGQDVYAQWQDVGPFEEDDALYVFGTANPKNKEGEQAGLDVSPAVRDYLRLSDVDVTSWQFVNTADVPEGPWRSIITTSKGASL